MINGLPFTRPFMLPFGEPFFKTGEGGIVEPAGFSAKYLSYLVDSMTLEVGDKVSQWDDQSGNNNNLTQATSANQPVLIQDANIYNNIVLRDQDIIFVPRRFITGFKEVVTVLNSVLPWWLIVRTFY